jgi:ammonia channel protein AmtB
MMIEWNGAFDGSQMLWLLVAAILLLLLLLPALMGLLSRGRVLQLPLNPEQWLTGAALHSALWLLVLHSLAFGPSLGTTPDDPGEAAPRPMSEMMRDPANQKDIRPFFGRGGFIGDLNFAGFAHLEAQGDPGEPLFASRRPHHSVSLSAFVILQLAVYLCAVGGVAAAAAATGASAARILGFTLGWGILIYVPVAHWVWGEGWLGIRHALDTGGSLFLLLISSSALVVGTRRSPTADMNHSTNCTNIEFFSVGLLWLSFPVLACSLQVPVAPLRSLMMLNLLAAAIGGFSCSGLLRLAFASGGTVPVYGLLTGMAATAAGAVLYDPMTALICGAAGTVTALIGCSLLKKWTVTAVSTIPLQISIAAAIGMLLPGLLASSSNGVFHWNRTPIESLIHGKSELLSIQALAVAAVSIWSCGGTAILSRLLKQQQLTE